MILPEVMPRRTVLVVAAASTYSSTVNGSSVRSMTTADYPQTRRDAVRLDVNARGWTDLSPHEKDEHFRAAAPGHNAAQAILRHWGD